jgi:hypothetical protein
MGDTQTRRFWFCAVIGRPSTDESGGFHHVVEVTDE